MGFHKSPGAYIETQYPTNISERMEVKTSDLMNIYALHRMRRMEPNYLQMKIKGVSVASFYTGFSFKHYVGKPNYCITVFLSDDDNPSNDFEGMLRRIAHELLPKKESLEFDDLLVDYYERLRVGSVDTYWEESIEGEGSKIATIHADEEEEEKEEEEEEPEPESHMEQLDFDEQFDKLEKEELKEEIKELKTVINEKNEKIRELTKQITEKVSEGSEYSEEVQMLQGQLDEANKRLDDWSEKLADLNEKNAILMETVRKLTEMSTQQNEEMERQGSTIIELKKQLERKNSQIEDMSNKLVTAKVESTGQKSELVEKLEEENQIHLDTIAELKIEMKQLKDKVEEAEGVQEDLSEQIISLKKDIKVLRRERDHYKEIIKKHDLLE
ncbi:MAG: hypothetical protein EU548_01430 [Promethearchaeota archaeon]|nr:MAG: hypothetical protein EU548_01430 [Candidatus Lokiarchaeota archaeon]